MSELDAYRERRRIQKRLYRQRHPEKRAEEKWRARFGLSAADYKRLSEAQGHRCAICGRPELDRHAKGGHKRLAVDHNHKTGEVRGLLCRGCNTGIGSLREDPVLLQRAAAYLLESAESALDGDFGPWGEEGCLLQS